MKQVAFGAVGLILVVAVGVLSMVFVGCDESPVLPERPAGISETTSPPAPHREIIHSLHGVQLERVLGVLPEDTPAVLRGDRVTLRCDPATSRALVQWLGMGIPTEDAGGHRPENILIETRVSVLTDPAHPESGDAVLMLTPNGGEEVQPAGKVIKTTWWCIKKCGGKGTACVVKCNGRNKREGSPDYRQQ